MRSSRMVPTLVLLLSVPGMIAAQIGIRGQIFLPNGAPVQRPTRFTLTTDNGMRNEILYTDSNGRIAMPQVSTPYTITVESDGESFETTRQSFVPPHSGNYIIVNLRPLRTAAEPPPGLVSVDRADQNVSPKAKEAYDSSLTLLKAEQYEQALEPLKRAIALQHDYFHAYNDLGVAYMKLNRLDEAADALRNAIKINGKVYLPQLNLGIVLNRQRKYKEAADLLLKLQPNNADLWKIHEPLIEALIGSQQWPQAEEEIKRALALKDSDVVDLKIKQGMVMIRQGKFGSAAEMLRDAVAAEPDNAFAHLNLGAALFESGSLDEAEAELRRAYEIKGRSMAGAQLLLGQVYHQKKDYPKAIDAFETYLRDLPDAPNRADVNEAIRRLRDALAKK